MAEQAGFDYYESTRRLASIGDASNPNSAEGQAISRRIQIARQLQNDALNEKNGFARAAMLSESFRTYPTSWYGNGATQAWEQVGVYDSAVHYYLRGLAHRDDAPRAFDMKRIADAYGLNGDYGNATAYYRKSQAIETSRPY